MWASARSARSLFPARAEQSRGGYVAIPDDRLGPSAGEAAEEIRRGMEDAFDRLAGLIGN